MVRQPPSGTPHSPWHHKVNKTSIRAASDDNITSCQVSKANILFLSGIFGYVNYLVERDRKYILDTLVNGEFLPHPSPLARALKAAKY